MFRPMATCQVCGADLPDGARFCPNCGTPVDRLLQTQERRLVTVLFADLTDSTALTRRLDSERVRDVLGAFYRAVSEELSTLRGEAEKFIGDAVMAVFGLPQAHEDDALRAVRAGLGIRARARRLGESLGLGGSALEVRIGIEAGDVAAGVATSRQLLVTGPAVNAAARLQAAAEPGEILVGSVTRSLTGDSVLFGEVREVAAKGFVEPLQAYPVQGLTTRSVRRTIPLIGRQTELTLMRDSLDRAISTGEPQLFTLLGDPGIGKSRLIDELTASLEPPSRSLVGRVQPPDWGPTFSAVIEMLQQLAPEHREGDGADIISALDHLLDRDDPESGRILRRLALLVNERGSTAKESTFVSEVQEGVVALIGQLARAAPMVVAFDGLERALPPVLELVERLAGRIDERPTPVLVIAAARSEIPPSSRGRAFGASARNHTTIQLAPLGEEASVHLAQHAGAAQLGSAVANRVATWADGNPFFIIEMTGQLLNDRAANDERLGAVVPPTVQAVVAARLDALPAPLRDLARRVSVFVFSFDLEELSLVADADPAQLDALEEAEVLVKQDRDPAIWRFRHETLRDVAYATLSKRERLRLHLQIADGLESLGRRSAWVPDHLERAALASLDLEPGNRSIAERAARALADAGDRARGRMESRTAVSRYERALSLTDPSAPGGRLEASLLAGLGEAHYWLGEYGPAEAALRRAEELAAETGDDDILATALRFRGEIVLNAAGAVEEAHAICTQALEAAERSGDEGVLCRTLLFAGWVPWNEQDFAAADEIWERALALARRTDDRWAEVRTLCSLSIAASERQDLERTRTYADAAMELAAELGDRFSMAVATVQVGRALQDGGDAAASLPHFDKALAIFDELGARWEYADALRTRGVALRDLDKLSEAETDLRAALKILGELGDPTLANWTWMSLAGVADRRGDAALAAHWRQHAEGRAHTTS